MKLTNILKLTVVVLLPFSVISCGDKKEDKEASTDSTATKNTHTEIGAQVSEIMGKLMVGMSEIKDVDSAKAFATNLSEHKESLKGLLAAAKELDPPTAEEKAAIQTLKDESDEEGEKLMSTMMEQMQKNPEAEAIGQVLSAVMQDKEMDEITSGLEELYDLKDK